MVRDHLYTLIVLPSDYSTLLERAVVGLLRMAIRLLHREDVADEVLASMQILLMIKTNILPKVRRLFFFNLVQSFHAKFFLAWSREASQLLLVYLDLHDNSFFNGWPAYDETFPVSGQSSGSLWVAWTAENQRGQHPLPRRLDHHLHGDEVRRRRSGSSPHTSAHIFRCWLVSTTDSSGRARPGGKRIRAE